MPFKQPPYDNIFGLGNKKKKAEKKIKKGEKALSKGNIDKAQRKFVKAGNKLAQTKDPDQSPIKTKIIEGLEKVKAQKEKRKALATEMSEASAPATQPGEMLAVEPTIPAGTGGSYQSSFPSEAPTEPFAEKQAVSEDEAVANEEAEANKGKVNVWLIVAIIAAIIFLPKLFKQFKK